MFFLGVSYGAEEIEETTLKDIWEVEINTNVDDIIYVEETWVFNENADVVEIVNVSVGANTGEDLDNVPITMETSSTDVNNFIDISNIKESSYIYYYGQWCNHCTNVDEYLTENDLYNKLNITKKEVWSNAGNAEEMKKDLRRLGLDVAKSWVPFIIWTIEKKEFPLPIGDKWIIEYFTHIKEILDWNLSNISYFNDYLARENPDLTTTTTETNRTIFIIVLVILAIVIPTILIKLTSKN